MMKVTVLASGSEGNATFIQTDQHRILIDIGKNAKYIKTKLESIGESAENIDAILISHTHKDHVAGLDVFSRKYKPIVYLTPQMFYDLKDLESYERVIIYEDGIIFNGLKITTIRTSHDVSDSRNFLIEYQGLSIVSITDTGYLNRKYFSILKDRDYYLIESNHDVEMLMNGSYPKWLKNRVVGTKGHLSNKDSGFYLTKLIGEHTKKITLMHLSHQNNTEERALETVRETFKEYNIEFDNIVCAKQDEITKVCE